MLKRIAVFAALILSYALTGMALTAGDLERDIDRTEVSRVAD